MRVDNTQSDLTRARSLASVLLRYKVTETVNIQNVQLKRTVIQHAMLLAHAVQHQSAGRVVKSSAMMMYCLQVRPFLHVVLVDEGSRNG